MNKLTIIAILTLLATFLITGYFYPQLPEKMAIHWDIDGTVNGYADKLLGSYLIPVIGIVVFAILYFAQKVDPKQENIAEFQKYYDGFILVFCFFMFYVQTLVTASNVNPKLNTTSLIVPGIAVLIYYVGMMLEKAKTNWTVGIRTPWTLCSTKVWDKTNTLGGKLFKASAIISLLGMLLGNYAIAIFLVSIFAAAVIAIVYSYIEYRKEKKKEILKS